PGGRWALPPAQNYLSSPPLQTRPHPPIIDLAVVPRVHRQRLPRQNDLIDLNPDSREPSHHIRLHLLTPISLHNHHRALLPRRVRHPDGRDPPDALVVAAGGLLGEL